MMRLGVDVSTPPVVSETPVCRAVETVGVGWTGAVQTGQMTAQTHATTHNIRITSTSRRAGLRWVEVLRTFAVAERQQKILRLLTLV